MARVTKKQISPLLTLPVELLYRIFDTLDAKTIFLAVRNVCTRLDASVNSYNRCHLDTNMASKREFRLICRLIRPENIISLSLTADQNRDEREKLFLSLV